MSKKTVLDNDYITIITLNYLLPCHCCIPRWHVPILSVMVYRVEASAYHALDNIIAAFEL